MVFADHLSVIGHRGSRAHLRESLRQKDHRLLTLVSKRLNELPSFERACSIRKALLEQAFAADTN